METERAMAKGTKRLTPGHLRKKGPAKLCDGGGLWLYISKENARSWVFRYRFQGKDYEIGLGGLSELAPGDARKTADEYRQAKKQGINPVDYRRKLEAQATSTFDEIAEKFVSIKQDEWINQKHIQQWR
ncbi:Arm DNA-binding domain-containing protein, partial [Thiolapillus sp.]